MPKRKHTAEENINKFREAEVIIAPGSTAVGPHATSASRSRPSTGGRRIKQLETENNRLKRAVAEFTLDNQILGEAAEGNSLSPTRGRFFVQRVGLLLGVSERRARKALEHPRSTQRHQPQVRYDKKALTNDIVGWATRFGRYSYRRITVRLRGAGW